MSRRVLAFLVVALLSTFASPAAGTAAAQEASPEASPIAGVTVETLASIELPADAIPSGEALAGFIHSTFDPGASASQPDLAPQRAVLFNVILAGQGAAMSDGALRIVHADGTSEDVPPGTEALLDPGDTAVYLEGGKALTLRNAGDNPMEQIGFGIGSTDEPATPQSGPMPTGVNGEGVGFLSPQEWAGAALPPGPLQITIQRVTLAPNAALPPASEPWPALRHVIQGTLTREAASGGAERYFTNQDVPWVPGGGDGDVTLRNAGDAPVLFWEMMITPAGSPTATPTS